MFSRGLRPLRQARSMSSNGTQPVIHQHVKVIGAGTAGVAGLWMLSNISYAGTRS